MPLLYNNNKTWGYSTAITVVKLRSSESYGVSFMSSSKKYDRDISRVQWMNYFFQPTAIWNCLMSWWCIFASVHLDTMSLLLIRHKGITWTMLTDCRWFPKYKLCWNTLCIRVSVINKTFPGKARYLHPGKPWDAITHPCLNFNHFC